MITYEWDIETYEEEDIVDHSFMLAVPKENEKLVLVRDDYVDVKSWAYVENNQLPEYFKDAYDRVVAKVPKRFFKELASFLAKNSTGPKI